ncbi:MAG TPA: NAD-dependent succinate-semialdehyde dehydrogenase [Prolixibacteraceae bacterium]|nr:NAD-dependent succinate-semialdehyde dehydrogenase [Prolixibacteraceae bacterium]
MKAINPTSGELIRTYEAHSEKGAEKIINSVDKAWQSWRSVPFRNRSALMLNMASLLRSERDRLALLITLEMGKVLRESKAEIEKCAWVCEYYAENAESFLQNEPISTEFKQSYISFQPLGTILAVMPWNFPFWQVFRFAAPTLMAGNTVVLKHASNVPGCALAIEELFREAGFPDNAFRSLLIDGKKVESLIAHPAIKAVTLTGSTPAGRSVASAAGRWLKKSVLELGGSDPYLILEDANLDEAARICAASRLLNAGQSCIAAKRFIVIESIFDEFSRRFTARMKEAVYGDPCHEETTLGPMARRELRDELHDQVIASVKQGAVILTGGMIPDQTGAFYSPTILSKVKPGMPAYQEELFGPVAALISARNEKQAVEIANDTSFGLGAAVFTRDVERGRWLAEEKLQAGSCFVNDMVKSDPRLPFGGINESGFGRELSVFGIREFVNIKTVAIR